MDKKNVVVLGAGFGGLRAALNIGKGLKRLGLTDKYQVFLVDRHDHHTYTPLLYEAATTSAETANARKLHALATFEVAPLVKHLPITFLKDEVEQLDLMEGDIHLKNKGKLPCDWVVLALGAEVNFFGIPGAAENTFPLKTFANAVAIRDKITALAKEKQSVSIIVGGGGPTGVELAAELKELCGEMRKSIKNCAFNVTIVEALPSILLGFDARVVESVKRRLAKLGVALETNAKIVGVDPGVVKLDGGRTISFDVMIWSGGVKASTILGQLPLSLDRGRPMAGGVLACAPQTPDLKLHMKVYGIGDNICYMNPKTQKAMPAVAPVAIAEGEVAAHNVLEEIKQAERPGYTPRLRTYTPPEYPYVIPVGGKFAMAKIGPLIFSGFVGWIFKGLVELDYIISIMPFWRGLQTWLSGLFIFIQNDRLG